MKVLKISDDSGFMGIINYEKYKSYLSEDWDFEMIKEKFISEINLHNLLFWGTGLENNWKVLIDTSPTTKESFKEEKGVIEITNQRLYLTNYETLTMAAQFKDMRLPEKHHEELFIELENGKYMVKFRQMFNPDKFNFESEEYHFEIIMMKIENHPSLYKNNVNKIYWSNY